VKAEEGVEDEEKTEEEANTGTEVCLSPGWVVLEIGLHYLLVGLYLKWWCTISWLGCT